MSHSLTRRRVAVLGVSVLTATALAGCNVDINPGSRATQEREITDVTAVVLATSGNLRLSVGEPSLTITAGESVLERLTTTIEGDTLEIDLPGRWNDPGQIGYDLVLPALGTVSIPGSGEVTGELAPDNRLTIDISGSGQIQLDPVDVSDVAVAISGSGAVTLEGRTGALAVNVPGAGRFSGRDLVARSAVVSIGGAGRADVNVTETLDASIAGSGQITYLGDPTVTSNVTGLGRIGEA